MKTKRSISYIFFIVIFALTPTVLAVSEEEVQNAVNASSKEAVSGSFFIWFLCAIAFLKVSQKIESFIASLGISSRKAGGSMLGEAMIAARGIGLLAKNTAGFAGFGKGGNSTSAGNVFSSSYGKSNSVSSSAPSYNGGGKTDVVNKDVHNTQTSGFGIGNMKMTGAEANSAFSSYFGYNSASSAGESVQINENGFEGSNALQDATGIQDLPQFSDIDIGDGVIEGTEMSSEFPDGIKFAMYDASQFNAPEGAHSVMTAVDNSNWYKQYEERTMEKIPQMGENGKITYSEKTVNKMPSPPTRKEQT